MRARSSRRGVIAGWWSAPSPLGSRRLSGRSSGRGSSPVESRKPAGRSIPESTAQPRWRNPDCDPQAKRIKLEWYAAAPCVKPWKAGADNGGATAQGVTSPASSRRALEHARRAAVRLKGTYVTRRPGRTIKTALKLATTDYNEIFKHSYETVGSDCRSPNCQIDGPQMRSRTRRRGEGCGDEPSPLFDAGGAGSDRQRRRNRLSQPDRAAAACSSCIRPRGRQKNRPDAGVNAAEFVGKALAGHPAKWAATMR